MVDKRSIALLVVVLGAAASCGSPGSSHNLDGAASDILPPGSDRAIDRPDAVTSADQDTAAGTDGADAGEDQTNTSTSTDAEPEVANTHEVQPDAADMGEAMADVPPGADTAVVPEAQPDLPAEMPVEVPAEMPAEMPAEIPACPRTDVITDCGTCGHVCAGPTEGTGTATCNNGVCGLDCGALTRCGTACIDTANDGRHCGGCNAPCGAGLMCKTGNCAPNCGTGLTACGATCVNLATDVDNCRSCGTRCSGPTAGPGSAVCTASGCDITCTGGFSKCGTVCVNLQSTLANCGTCGHVCPAPSSGMGTAVCSGGNCSIGCFNGQTPCGGACVNTATDRSNCGACGVVCHANAVCSGLFPACKCSMGYTGDGTTCAVEDECATGNNRCGGVSGTCSAGAGLGYTCTCRNGFTSTGGTFPKCYKSGTLTFGGNVWAYDFMNGIPKDTNFFQEGDFYTTDSDNFHTLFANNTGERGVQRVTSSAPLLEVPIPADGYNLFGVPVLDAATYVSLAREPDTDYYIVFRVTAFPASGFTMDWVMVYRR